VEVEAEFGSVQFSIGQGLIHSMSRAVSMLMDVQGAWQQQDAMEYYVICNSTQQSLCFGQVCGNTSHYIYTRTHARTHARTHTHTHTPV